MLFTITDMGLISVSGKDAARFLQGQLTCDINSLTETSLLAGAYCSQQGRVQTTFRIFRCKGIYYLYLSRALVAVIIEQFKKYAIFSKVEIMDCSSTLNAIGITGSDIQTVLSGNHYILPTGLNEVTQGNNFWLARLPATDTRYLLIGSNKLIDEISKAPAVQITTCQQSWELYDIEQGFPVIYPQTSNQFTPHALDYDRLGGISFNKGCYIGQEIIARTHYRGQVKQHLHRAIITSLHAPIAGDKVTDASGSAAGTIINGARRDNNEYEILAVLSESAIHKGELYFVDAKLALLPLL